MEVYNKYKDEIEKAKEELNPFHIALCKVIELTNKAF
jgi:hypothetical protein